MKNAYDDFDRALLRAGRRARAPSELRARALSAAAGGASLVAATAAAKASSSGGIAKVVAAVIRSTAFKWTVIGAACTSSAGAVYNLETRPAGPPVVVQAPAAASVTSLPRAAEARGAGTTEAVAPPSPEGMPEAARTPPPLASAALHERPASRAAAAKPAMAAPVVTVSAPAREETTPSSLREEVVLVDAARKALADGDPSSALRRVDEHALRFSDGAFSIEREVIRIDALVAGGRSDEAAAHARAFVARYPSSAQATRIAKVKAPSDRIP